MDNLEIKELLADLESVGARGSLSNFGHDLDDVREITGGKGYHEGARVFFDPQKKVRYVSHQSGYVRRYVPTIWRGTEITSRYTLNKREKTTDGYWRSKAILLKTEEERIELIVRGIRNYRKNN